MFRLTKEIKNCASNFQTTEITRSAKKAFDAFPCIVRVARHKMDLVLSSRKDVQSYSWEALDGSVLAKNTRAICTHPQHREDENKRQQRCHDPDIDSFLFSFSLFLLRPSQNGRCLYKTTSVYKTRLLLSSVVVIDWLSSNTIDVFLVLYM